MEDSNNRGAGAGGGAGRVMSDSENDESDDENNERRARRRDTRRGARERRARAREIHCIRGTARVDDEAAVRAEIRTSEATHVVSFIGRTHGVIGDVEYGTIDYLEQEGKLYENIRDNLFGPMVLAMVCKEMRVHFTYLGTGCIFEYDEEHPLSEPITGRSEGVNMNTMVRGGEDGEGAGESTGFREGDRPNFFGSSYSVVKGFTDRLMHMFEEDVLQLRIRMPITGRRGPRNFITKIATYVKVCSIPNSMSVLPDLLPIALRMMLDRKTGTYNFTNPGVISHNEILAMYREIVDEGFTWENFTVEEQGEVIASKRSNNYLDTTKLEREYPEVRSIHEAVRAMLVKYAATFWDEDEGNAGGERMME